VGQDLFNGHGPDHLNHLETIVQVADSEVLVITEPGPWVGQEAEQNPAARIKDFCLCQLRRIDLVNLLNKLLEPGKLVSAVVVADNTRRARCVFAQPYIFPVQTVALLFT
jgi:hypothetical protein